MEPQAPMMHGGEAPKEERTIKIPKLRAPKWKLKNSKWLIVAAFLVVGGTAGFFYNDNQKSKAEIARLSDPQESARIEAQKLVAQLSVFMELPDETPTVATVSDAGKLKNQAFFANAENGDKVIIFSNAKKAVLYRPSTNKVIEVAPVNLGNQK